jgi:hypothetical protein
LLFPSFLSFPSGTAHPCSWHSILLVVETAHPLKLTQHICRGKHIPWSWYSTCSDADISHPMQLTQYFPRINMEICLQCFCTAFLLVQTVDCVVMKLTWLTMNLYSYCCWVHVHKRLK